MQRQETQQEPQLHGFIREVQVVAWSDRMWGLKCKTVDGREFAYPVGGRLRAENAAEQLMSLAAPRASGDKEFSDKASATSRL